MESKRLQLCTCLLVLLATGSVAGDERLKGIACRSVHLGYGQRNATAFYNEVTVRQTAPGTYFMVCGWNTGYFGIQELANGRKLVLFSVWDPTQGDDPRAVEEDVRVKVLHQHPDVRVKRFGGEGTGGQCFFDFDWQVDSTYAMLVTCRPQAERTEYTGYFYLPAKRQWIQLVTFSTITGGRKMQGLYSFVEDFKRDRKSTEFERRAEFGNTWVKVDGEFSLVERARFTADANPVENIAAGKVKNRFFLATGGGTVNDQAALQSWIQLPEQAQQKLGLPENLPGNLP